MNIKIGNEYLDFEDNVEVVKRAKTTDTIDSAGDFSYSFELPITSKNARILKLGVNRSDKIIYQNVDAVIENLGNQVYFGFLRVERILIETVRCSFFSGNNNWFNALDGLKIYELDLSEFAINQVNTTPSSTLISAWSNTEGITFPLLDRGTLRKWNTRVVSSSDFIPMVYVKSVLPAIFQQNGFKVNGELLNDSLYNNIVVGSGSRVVSPESEGVSIRNAYIGKGGAQVISTTPQLLTFTDENFPYYNQRGNWASNRYTSDIEVDVRALINIELSASKQYLIELYVNGVSTYTLAGTGVEVNDYFNAGNAFPLEPGDYLEVYMSIDSGTPSVTDGEVRVEIVRLRKIYPQFLLDNMSQMEFINNIFTMFNVISYYDQFTKTVTLNLFKNISSKPEQDLSDYISDYEIDFTEVVDEFSKRNVFAYEPGDDEEQVEYDSQNIVPWGAGVIEPNNDFISGESEKSVSFSAPYNYYNPRFGANLESTGTRTFSEGGSQASITDVSSSGGLALFKTADPHGFEQLDYVEIVDTSVGLYIGVGRVQSVPNPDEFIIQNLEFISVGATPVTGTAQTVTLNDNDTTKVFIGINIPNMAVSDFSSNNSIEYGNEDRTHMAYMYFLKSNIGQPIDEMRESLSFGNPSRSGYNQITLLDKYYGLTMRYLDDPVKVIANMHIPFKVFNDLDFSRPCRLRTRDFDIKGFVQNIEGWVSSSEPCEVSTIKLS